MRTTDPSKEQKPSYGEITFVKGQNITIKGKENMAGLQRILKMLQKITVIDKEGNANVWVWNKEKDKAEIEKKPTIRKILIVQNIKTKEK